MKYNYKDKYYDNQGNDIEYIFSGNVHFLTASRLSGGLGNRENPITSTSVTFPNNAPKHCVLDGGFHHRVLISWSPASGSNDDLLSGFVGTDKYVTKMKLTGELIVNAASNGAYKPNLYFKDLAFNGGSLNIKQGNGGTGAKFRFINCIISSDLNFTGSTASTIAASNSPATRNTLH